MTAFADAPVVDPAFLTPTFATPSPEVSRDRYGRPLVIPRGGGRPRPYTRVTTFVKACEDTYNLERWGKRMTALGIVDNPHLALAVAAHREDKDKLNRLCDEATEAAKASASATTGTALHKLTEYVDRGVPLPGAIPASAQADLDAYAAATAAFEVVQLEAFGVLDDLEVAGTCDRIVRWRGQTFIADLKTGSTIDFGIGAIAQQLACYARMDLYDPRDGTRTPTGAYPTAGLVIHLPAGEARCEVVWVDLGEGWKGVELSAHVRAWRRLRRGDLTRPFAP